MSEMVSPSPAKSLSNEDIAYWANLAISNAKERTTPAQSPCPAWGNWSTYEEDLAPCQLSFADADADELSRSRHRLQTGTNIPVVPDFNIPLEAEPVMESGAELSRSGHRLKTGTGMPVPVEAEPVSIVQQSKKVAEDPKPFDVNDIPSPTRNRAKRQQALLAAMAAKEEDGYFSCDEVDFPQSCVLAGHWTAEETVGNTAEVKEVDQARRLRDAAEKAGMEAMDKHCVDNFLDTVKQCAKYVRVRTPIKGTNLYTKHMRPNRPVGTSVDVKDSSFRNLRGLLLFLESEGLLSLQPGQTDSVVTAIHFEACRKYNYVARSQPSVMAPHNAGCCCRKCTVSTTGPATGITCLWQ